MNASHYHQNPWKIIEQGWNPENVKSSESIFSVQILKKIILDLAFKEVTLGEFIIRIRLELVGGKMGIPNILLKY